jgi:hypothetical protein
MTFTIWLKTASVAFLRDCCIPNWQATEADKSGSSPVVFAETRPGTHPGASPDLLVRAQGVVEVVGLQIGQNTATTTNRVQRPDSE